ncbi:MAG: hemerythrin domain-containing protein [Sulfuricella sp.]|nr:hemerythrin domain-containing protein [Sulfuricella sp.]
MPTPFTWNDQQHALNLPEMDATHREFVALLIRAQNAPDAELLPILDELIEHTRTHFEHESGMMAACALGSRAEHEAEHRRVLAELAQMRERAAKGRLMFVRAYLADGVPDWFRNHLATMDADLAGKYKRAFPSA